MAYNFINMDNKCLFKFVITSICIMTAILMLIITHSVYISNAVAQTNENDIETAPSQTNENDIETNRIIDRQRTPSSEENAIDDVGNAPSQTNENDIETAPSQTNENDIETAPSQTNENDIETNETEIETNRIIIRQRTPSS